MTAWHQINWASCQRQVVSLQRRLVQVVQAGVWRKVKRLSSLLVHSFAGRALAVKRVSENTGKKTPGLDRDLWDTPTKKVIEMAAQWLSCPGDPIADHSGRPARGHYLTRDQS
jgi:RNA-directed DNA polymerase